MSNQRRHAWMSKDLGALVALGILSAAAAGCIGPPSCTDFERTKRSVALNSVSLANDDSFTIPRRGHFASCRTFCAVESGVESVHDCKAPTGNAQKGWVIECDVEATTCSSEELIGLPGHGRLPEGFRPEGARDHTLGEYFALAAQLEAVSVPAFRRLALELAVHDAPASLVRAARSAARDEVKHTRMMRALAREHGVEPTFPRIGRLPVRGLEAIAIENAVEGCVGETLGAIVATAQATHAEDNTIRRAMSVVARDETKHSILAWRVHAWSLGRLDAAAQGRVRMALMDATHVAMAGTVAVRSAAARARAGLPDLAGARAMIQAAREDLWDRVA